MEVFKLAGAEQQAEVLLSVPMFWDGLCHHSRSIRNKWHSKQPGQRPISEDNLTTQKWWIMTTQCGTRSLVLLAERRRAPCQLCCTQDGT